ncbi:hypothetical protein [Bradyrhizobium sp. LMG 9283]|uniref:hypothetical protein n=1 Tax=Bradyrhizobium sp. LMG 9283 TaxID=592064 RepID=UPI00388F86DA
MNNILFKTSVPLAIALMLAGCVTPASFTRPDLPSDIDWQVDAAAIRNPSTIEPWWQSFGDPSLDKLIPVVLASNNDLLAASLRARRAMLEADIISDRHQPKFSGDFGASRTDQLEGGQASSGRSSINPKVSYELDLWGRLAAQRDVGALKANATIEDIEAARLTVIARRNLSLVAPCPYEPADCQH